MALFESLVLLLFVAALLLAASRRLAIPYPTLLSIAGVGVALLPFAPDVAIDPHLALALFIAPALLDAAFDTAPRALKRLWAPLLALAVGAVVATTAAVAAAAVLLVGLPVAAAIALGAIVAPPDAAAAKAVLGAVGFPRRSSLVLQGESLLNDATALLIFSAATALAMGSMSDGGTLRIALAAPGGIAFGIAAAIAYGRLKPLFARTLSGTIVEFTATFGIWLLAERLGLSPVLAVVAYAMMVAHRAPATQSARDRIQSYAVWAAAVFILNVLAFLLMGLQARAIAASLAPGDLGRAAGFAAIVLLIVIVARMVSVLGYRLVAGWAYRRFDAPAWIAPPPPWRLSLLVSWCGMRGLLTMATAFALPSDFPGRGLIVLTAFIVVLGTLVLQGMTLRPLMKALGVGEDPSLEEELARARQVMIAAGLDAAQCEPADVAALLRTKLDAADAIARSDGDPQGASRFDQGFERNVAAQRAALHALRRDGDIANDIYQRLEEELDWLEMAARPTSDLEIEET